MCICSGYSHAAAGDDDCVEPTAQRQDSWSGGWSDDAWGGGGAGSEQEQPGAAAFNKPELTAKTRQYRQQQKEKKAMSSTSHGGDEWDTWGPAAAAVGSKDNNKVKDEENELEKWLNDDTWDGGQSVAAAAKSSSSGTSTNSSKSSSSSSSRTKSKSKSSAASKSSSGKKNIPQPSEPAVVDNLIDFGAADVTSTTATTTAGDGAAEGSGWEEETWATVDDGWESLELSGAKTSQQ